MWRNIISGVALFCLALICHYESPVAGFEAAKASSESNGSHSKNIAFKELAQELSDSSKLQAGSKIAIMPFSYGDNKTSVVGTMVSERLTTQMVKVGKFNVIERQLLNNVMDELHLEGTGVMDVSTTQKIGKVLGVDAIIAGTVLDLNEDSAEINARIIKTETAEVVASASTEIDNTWTTKPVKRLYTHAERAAQKRNRLKMIRDAE